VGKRRKEMFEGYKTYIVAFIMAAVALLDWFGIEITAFGEIEPVPLLLEALAIAGLRRGVSTRI
jgi:hypothetical protein